MVKVTFITHFHESDLDKRQNTSIGRETALRDTSASSKADVMQALSGSSGAALRASCACEKPQTKLIPMSGEQARRPPLQSMISIAELISVYSTSIEQF